MVPRRRSVRTSPPTVRYEAAEQQRSTSVASAASGQRFLAGFVHIRNRRPHNAAYPRPAAGTCQTIDDVQANRRESRTEALNGPGQEFLLGGYSLRGLIRRVRRAADLSQRELAKHAGVAPSTIGAIECGTKLPGLRTLQRILNTAGYQLAVLDRDDRLVVPLMIWGGIRDGAGRRYPAHLDTIIDPEYREWWASIFGLAKPPETFRRSRVLRDYERQRSQWEVRVAKYRLDPPPEQPNPERYPTEDCTQLHDT